MWKLLVIDDEPDRVEQISDWFKSIGFEVISAYSGREGLQKARDSRPDVIILDIIMPGMDGHEVLLRLKRDLSMAKIPVVVCSFKADELDGLQDLMRTGLREGADYVVARKWGLPALEEVVRRVLRPSAALPIIKSKGNVLRLGEGCREIWVNDNQRRLTPLESRTLAYLNSRRGQPCSTKDILDAIYEGVGEESCVYRIIQRLRRKLEPDPQNPIFIVNEKGFGYKLTEGEP